jgi:hypothetical protein
MSATLITLLIQAGLTYGPEFVTSIIAIMKNPNATFDDVEALFSKVKPYSAYGIPDKPATSAPNTVAGLPTNIPVTA